MTLFHISVEVMWKISKFSWIYLAKCPRLLQLMVMEFSAKFHPSPTRITQKLDISTWQLTCCEICL
jgi:hypothetical protein